MKLKFDIKNKNADFEADIEKLVEKGMDQHEKDWKDKFNTKHSAKKEMLELKHKHKMDLEESNKSKKNWFQKIQEEKIRLKELEIAEQRRREEEEKNVKKIKVIASIVLGITGSLLLILGFIIGGESGNPDSGWYSLTFVGLMAIMSIAFLWGSNDDQKKKRKNK